MTIVTVFALSKVVKCLTEKSRNGKTYLLHCTVTLKLQRLIKSRTFPDVAAICIEIELFKLSPGVLGLFGYYLLIVRWSGWCGEVSLCHVPLKKKDF